LHASVPISGVIAAAVSMAVYSSVVSKLEVTPDVPDDTDLAAHHVRGSDGKTVKFRNPHSSAGEGDSLSASMLGKVLW
jgi:hypothetical protein